MEMEMEMEMEAARMDEKEEEEMRACRIFVGGVGEKVTEEDLHKTFSSLGRVKGVEFVKTSGRSFAYIDFQPRSHKSLSKLFSSYNGCVWKGGRLRLEKAKDHYLVRLRKQWDQDAQLAHKTNNHLTLAAHENKDAPAPKNPKLLTQETKQLQIFFPRLRKVKSVPYSGTGKHKYSFQRIEVPSLPIHFCDCEEHCVSSEMVKAKKISHFEEQAGNANGEELNMMTSVMNRIFKREVNLSTEYSKVIVPTEGGSSNHLIDDVPTHESDNDQDNDADDLVINIAGGVSSQSGLKRNNRLENINQGSKFGKRPYSHVGSTHNKVKAQNEEKNDPFNSSDTIANKKPRLLLSDETNRNEFTSTMTKKKGHPETYPKESKGLHATQSDQKGSNQQLPTGILWRQKSSWRELVGETGKSSFSILPVASMNQILPKFSVDTASTTDSKVQMLRTQASSRSADSESEGLAKDEILQDKVSTDGPSVDTQKSMKLGRFESAGFKPEGLTNDEMLHDKLSTDGPSVDGQKSMNQGRFESTGFDPVGLTKDEIAQDKVSIDGPSIVTQYGTPSKESKSTKEVQLTEQKADPLQVARGRSWIQKSSWRELVGGMENSSFSFSNILPDIGSKSQNLQNYNGTGTVDRFDSKPQNSTDLLAKFMENGSNGVGKFGILHDNLTPTGSSMASSAKKKETLAGSEDVSNKVGRNSQNEEIDTREYSKSSRGKNTSAPNKKVPMDTRIGEFCTFIRSSESRKEWSKAKAALSGSLKKKSNEN